MYPRTGSIKNGLDISNRLIANEGINLIWDIDPGQNDGGFSAILYNLNGMEGNNIIVLDNYTAK